MKAWSDVMTAVSIEDPEKLTIPLHPPEGYRFAWPGEVVSQGAMQWSERICRWLPCHAYGWTYQPPLDRRLVCRVVVVRVWP